MFIVCLQSWHRTDTDRYQCKQDRHGQCPYRLVKGQALNNYIKKYLIIAVISIISTQGKSNNDRTKLGLGEVEKHLSSGIREEQAEAKLYTRK